MKQPWKILTLFAVDLLALAVAFGAGVAADRLVSRRSEQPGSVKLDTFWQVWQLVDKDYIHALPDPQARVYGAIRGSLSTLNDPYTVFVEPQPHQREKEDLQGSFGGIGVTMRRTQAGDIVITPLPDSPAAKVGVLDGDILISVDSKPLSSTVTFDDIINLVRGKVGTEVTIGVRRPSTNETLSFKITRQVIETPSVTYRILDNAPQIGYIAINRFTERSGDEVKSALQDLQKKGAKQIILDLRDNGGGLLTSAVDVTSQFVGSGVVLYEQQKGQPEHTFSVKPGGVALDMPLVVLVNHGTASASEITAGALRDHDRATLVGELTYGKGSVQHVYDLEDGSSVHITAAEWFTPNRHQLTGNGLVPDITVARSADDAAAGRDPQLDRAVDYLQGK